MTEAFEECLMQSGEKREAVGVGVGPRADGEFVVPREELIVAQGVKVFEMTVEGGPAFRTVGQGEGGLSCINGASVFSFTVHHDFAGRGCSI